jgi:GTP cyclohydrolase I
MKRTAPARVVDAPKIERAVRSILEAVGEDPDREGLRETPARIARLYAEVFSGLGQDPREQLKVFADEEHEELVLVKDIPFHSMCEHHLLPFFGKAHVAYIPRKGRLSGVSKLARVVEVCSRRPQVQERLTSQVADALMQGLKPHGVLVMVEAEHLCMTMRGVRKPGSLMVTSAIRGAFTKPATRAEVMALISKHP